MNLHIARGLFLVCVLSVRSAFASPTDSLGTLVGRVVDEKGLGLQWASVTILNAARGAQTDRTGTYRVSSIPPGRYTVRARMVGYAKNELAKVQINAGDTTSADFKMKEIPIRMFVGPVVDGPSAYRVPMRKSMSVASGVLYLGGNRFQAPLTLRCDDGQVVVNRWRIPPTERRQRSAWVPTRDDTLAFALGSTPTALARYGASVGLTPSEILDEMRRRHASSPIATEAWLDSGEIQITLRSRTGAQNVSVPDPVPMRDPTRGEIRSSDDFYLFAALRETKADLERDAVVVISRKGWAKVSTPYAEAVDEALKTMQGDGHLSATQQELLERILPRNLLEELKAPIRLVESAK